MSTIPSAPPAPIHTVPAHAPIGKPAVGLESFVHKDAPLPPVEDATESERLRHRDVIVKLSGDAERERGQPDRQAPHDNAAPQDDPPPNPEPPTQEAVLQPAGANPYQARHLAEFETHSLPPGSLLDQTI